MKTFQNSGAFGDLKKFKVEVNDEDITDAVSSCFIYQDMFSPTNTATIVVNDTANLLLNIPIFAGASVKITYETEHGSDNDGEKEWVMEIYKIGEKDVTNPKVQTYTLFAAHSAFTRNQTKKIQKAFKDKKVSAIVQELAGQLGVGVDAKSSDGNVSVLIPNWTPLYAINWCAKFALKSNAADYVFFQKHDDTFVFKPFEFLFSSDDESSGITFTIKPTGIVDSTGDPGDHTTIVTRYHFEHYDALSNMASGYYKSKLLTYDFIEKTFEETPFSFGDDCPKDLEKLRTDSGTLMSGEDANITFSPLHPGMLEDPSYLDTSSKWSGSRKSSLMKFEQEKLMIQLPGSAKSCEWFGQNCEFNLPSQVGEEGEEFDKQRRGRYLITAMAHMFTGGMYILNAELVKKRLEKVDD